MIGHHYVNQILAADHQQHLRSEADLFRASQAREAQRVLRRRAAGPPLFVRLARRLANFRTVPSEVPQASVAATAATSAS